MFPPGLWAPSWVLCSILEFYIPSRTPCFLQEFHAPSKLHAPSQALCFLSGCPPSSSHWKDFSLQSPEKCRQAWNLDRGRMLSGTQATPHPLYIHTGPPLSMTNTSCLLRSRTMSSSCLNICRVLTRKKLMMNCMGQGSWEAHA